MSEGLLDCLKEYWTVDSDITRLKGVNGSPVCITKWIVASFTLSNDQTLEIPFAVVAKIKASIILGLPFLVQLVGRIDHTNRVIETEKGNISLSEGFKTAQYQLNTTEVDSDRIDVLLQKAELLNELEKTRLKQLLTKFQNLYEGDRKGIAATIQIQVRFV